MEIIEIELMMMRSWPALEEKTYDGWIMRFSEGYTKRANSINPMYESYFDLEEKYEYCRKLYEEKKLFGKTIAFVEERSHDNEDSIISGVSIDTTEIFDIFPEVARRLKSLPLTIREALKKYEYNYVKSTAEYTALFCKTSYLKYFNIHKNLIL